MPDAPRALIYVDTSAIVKVLFAEAESEPLRRWLAAASRSLVSSALLEVELARTVIRARTQSSAILTYDVRMIQAAQARSLGVVAPA